MKLYFWEGRKGWIILCMLVILKATQIEEVAGSWGDLDARFDRCVHRVMSDKCEESDPSLYKQPLTNFSKWAQEATAHMRWGEAGDYASKREQQQQAGAPFQRPWWHKLMHWRCFEEARYQCMHQNRELREKQGEKIEQYYGKWPFQRVWGVQELFSSLFSVLNGVPHVIYLVKMARMPSLQPLSAYNNFRAHWMSFAAIAINTWLWSAVFHARDTPVTEKMDYFCAFSVIVWGLWVAVCRTLVLRLSHQILLLVLLLTFFFYHIYWMGFVQFSYGYNTQLNAAFAFTSSFFWLVWAFKHRDRAYVYLLVFAIIGVYPMTLLEFLDFPPLWLLLDAHALWHFSTIPFAFVMYEGALRDLEYEAAPKKKAFV